MAECSEGLAGHCSHVRLHTLKAIPTCPAETAGIPLCRAKSGSRKAGGALESEGRSGLAARHETLYDARSHGRASARSHSFLPIPRRQWLSLSEKLLPPSAACGVATIGSRVQVTWKIRIRVSSAVRITLIPRPGSIAENRSSPSKTRTDRPAVVTRISLSRKYAAALARL